MKDRSYGQVEARQADDLRYPHKGKFTIEDGGKLAPYCPHVLRSDLQVIETTTEL